MEDLVGSVAGHLVIAQGKLAGVADAEIRAGPALAGDGDHILADVHADRRDPPVGQLGHRPARAAPHIDGGIPRPEPEQFVRASAEQGGGRDGLTDVEQLDEFRVVGHTCHHAT
nr:hypothetical protein [Nonomuraea cypriaca]